MVGNYSENPTRSFYFGIYRYWWFDTEE